MSSEATSRVHAGTGKESIAGSVLVIGLGEVGGPLQEIIGARYDTVGIDLEPIDFHGRCEVMHICYPYTGTDFIRKTAEYVYRYSPRVTIVNSTVAPGTTRAIQDETGFLIAHSPVRGKHSKMNEDLINYVKFVGSTDQDFSRTVAEHFQSLGMRTRILSSPEATELAKLTETTYFAQLIAWAQEVERYCDDLNLNYDEVVSFYEKISFFPPVGYFPGLIGGHCILPNIEILKTVFTSAILDAIQESNQLKIERERRSG